MRDRTSTVHLKEKIAMSIKQYLQKNPQSSYVIAEVGQNHQGSFDMALDYVKKFADLGASAIKFQTRDNKYLFDETSYNQPYNSSNAFAETYGAHREFLEFDYQQVATLKEHCELYNTEFISTPFDEPSLALLMKIGVEKIKVASFDCGNLPFLKKVGETKKTVILSSGGSNAKQIADSVSCLRQAGTIDIVILHCVSEYPCKAENLALSEIPKLVKEYPDCTIGLSDHYNGILSATTAYMMGARVFEKHVTFDRSLKGTDHSFALEPDGFRKMVRDLNRVPQMLGLRKEKELGEEAVFKKLGKSIIASKNLEIGTTLKHEDLSGRIFAEKGTPVRESINFLSRRLKKSKKAGEKIYFEDIE